MKKARRMAAIGPKTDLLAKLRSVGLSPLALIFLVVLGIAPLFIEDEYILRLMVMSLLLGTQAMVFDFTASFINVINFGFAAFVGLGAYTSALLVVELGVSPWLGLIAGTLAAGILGVLTGILTLRLRGIYASVMAWFVGLTLMALTSAWTDLTRGTRGINVPLLLDTAAMRPYFYILLPIAVGIYIIMSAITKSYIGLAFKAIGQNIEAARSSGIDPTKYKVINWTVSCAFAGSIGGFYAHFIGILIPSVMATSRTVEVLALSYIGGPGSLWGGLVAAFLVIPIFDYLKSLMEIRLIIYALLLSLTMIFYPEGLAGTYRWAVEKIKSSRSGEK